MGHVHHGLLLVTFPLPRSKAELVALAKKLAKPIVLAILRGIEARVEERWERAHGAVTEARQRWER